MSDVDEWSWLAQDEEIETFGPTSNALIVLAESRVGRFPPEYRSFVERFGAARIAHREICGIHPWLPKDLDVAEETLWERAVPHRPLPDGLLAVYNDGGGNRYCVRAAGGHRDSHGPDEVVAWWHDDQSPPEVMASSFVAWMKSLRFIE